jgi:hypothetical protein
VDTGIARALNMQIRRLADMLPGGLEHVYGFSCECGCGGTLQLSAAEFDQRSSARLDGHGDDETEAVQGSFPNSMSSSPLWRRPVAGRDSVGGG